MAWTFVLTDLLGAQLGEITNARSRSINWPLNRIPTASFQVASNHALAKYFQDQTWDGMLKVYDNGTLRFVGPIVSSDDQYDDQLQMQMVTVTASGPMWRLGFKLLGKDPNGYLAGSVASPADVSGIVAFILAAANADWPTHATSSSPYTGIEPGTFPTTGILGTAGPFWFKPASDAIAELAVGAFDFQVVPVEPQNVSKWWPQIGTLNTYVRLGLDSNITTPTAVFESGTTKANLRSYARTIDRSKRATLGFIQQPAATDHSGTLWSVNDAAELTGGRFESLVDDGGVQWDALRQKLVDRNVAVRKQAQQIVSVTCSPNATPRAWTDFIPGDDIHIYLKLNESFALNAITRCWGIQMDIDQNGNETQTIATVPA